MVEAKAFDENKEKKDASRRRHDSSSSSSSETSSASSGSTSGSTTSSSSTHSDSSETSVSSRSPTPRKASSRGRGRSSGRRSRSPKASVTKVDHGDKPIIASSRRSPTPERRRRRSPTPKRRRSVSRERGRDRDKEARRGRERSRSKDRKSPAPRKPTPPPRRLCIRNLSRNVTKEHLSEIFSVYGTLKSCEMPMDRQHTHLGRGYGYVEFEQPEDADKALKHMDGGQIDGQEVTCELTHQLRSSFSHNGNVKGGRSPPRYVSSLLYYRVYSM
ncbi:hypothetical protein AB6A40_007085 [Gnathostoma spinigerum]|uniref:RRM domain-containing protein n=1 Tax=Gnathostoma spinigerum TaxID=75299 RepID=A0ABD6EKT2_9BILA